MLRYHVQNFLVGITAQGVIILDPPPGFDKVRYLRSAQGLISVRVPDDHRLHVTLVQESVQIADGRRLTRKRQKGNQVTRISGDCADAEQPPEDHKDTRRIGIWCNLTSCMHKKVIH